MTGNLVLKGDPTSNLMAATKQYVDNNRTPAELNVLTSRGTTVKAVKGSTTLTATAGSDGWAKLYPSEFGEWTVTAGSTSKTINIDAIAVFYLVMSDLGSLSWSQVAAISKMGLASTLFHIGDEKTLTVNGVSYTAVIIGFDHDTPVDTATYPLCHHGAWKTQAHPFRTHHGAHGSEMSVRLLSGSSVRPVLCL